MSFKVRSRMTGEFLSWDNFGMDGAGDYWEHSFEAAQKDLDENGSYRHFCEVVQCVPDKRHMSVGHLRKLTLDFPDDAPVCVALSINGGITYVSRPHPCVFSAGHPAPPGNFTITLPDNAILLDPLVEYLKERIRTYACTNQRSAYEAVLRHLEDL